MEVTQHYNNMNMNEVQQNDAEVQEYQSRETNRNEALALLAKLKARETPSVSKVFWKNGQPTLVESTSKLNWDERLTAMGFLRAESRGLPATESHDRTPSSWERKMEGRRRANYTLEETPTMAFKASGHLPAHYYMDESALESYVESLTKEL